MKNNKALLLIALLISGNVAAKQSLADSQQAARWITSNDAQKVYDEWGNVGEPEWKNIHSSSTPKIGKVTIPDGTKLVKVKFRTSEGRYIERVYSPALQVKEAVYGFKTEYRVVDDCKRNHAGQPQLMGDPVTASCPGYIAAGYVQGRSCHNALYVKHYFDWNKSCKSETWSRMLKASIGLITVDVLI